MKHPQLGDHGVEVVGQIGKLIAQLSGYDDVVIALGNLLGGIDQFTNRLGDARREDEAEKHPDDNRPAADQQHGPHRGMGHPLRAVAPGHHGRLVQFQQSVAPALDGGNPRPHMLAVVAKCLGGIGARQSDELREVEHSLVEVEFQLPKDFGLPRNGYVVFRLRQVEQELLLRPGKFFDQRAIRFDEQHHRGGLLPLNGAAHVLDSLDAPVVFAQNGITRLPQSQQVHQPSRQDNSRQQRSHAVAQQNLASETAFLGCCGHSLRASNPENSVSTLRRRSFGEYTRPGRQ